ncbi:MAG: hypothetical protein NTY74_15110 [Ignavibacteriae bacterium]|nr:hypothetical protein [Ignavibacteriota bacterium]
METKTNTKRESINNNTIDTIELLKQRKLGKMILRIKKVNEASRQNYLECKEFAEECINELFTGNLLDNTLKRREMSLKIS